MRKITVTKEILDWNVSQVKVTESIVVFLQLRSSIYIFTDSLFFLLSLFSFISFCVHWAISQFFPVRFAHSNGRLQWRISLFGQHESFGRSLTFRASAYRWRNTVIGRGCAPGISKTTPIKLLKLPESYPYGSSNNLCLPLKCTNSNTNT